jgi:hypothetical protein
MKKLLFLSALAFGTTAQAQIITQPAEPTPNDSLVITVDLSALDQSKDHTQRLLQAASNGEDMYIWTWKPYEFPAGHPKANGIGGAAWKNSNPVLRMTHMGGTVYKFVFTPTLKDWYETDAATVYNNDVHFLVKPLDGGGYGDPDIKSEDLSVKVDPPGITRDPQFGFPLKPSQKQLFVLTYDNTRETKPTMQNLAPDDCWFFAECVADSVTYRIANSSFAVKNFPQLQMAYEGSGIFKSYFIPERFFPIPPGAVITSMKFVIQRKNFSTGSDRVTKDLLIEIKCD